MSEAAGQLTIRDVLQRAADEFGYKTAIKEGDIQLSFTELEAMLLASSCRFFSKKYRKR